MTRDEVRELIKDAAYTTWVGYRSWGEIAEAVLAAFAARGIVLGESVANDEYQLRTVQVGIQYAAASECMDDLSAGQAKVFVDDMSKCGLALVLVVQ